MTYFVGKGVIPWYTPGKLNNWGGHEGAQWKGHMKEALHIYTNVIYDNMNYLLSFSYSCLMLIVSSLLRVNERCKTKICAFKTSDGRFSSVMFSWSLHFWSSVIPVVPKCSWSELHSCDGIPKQFKDTLFSPLSPLKSHSLISTHLALSYPSSSLFPVSWELAKSLFSKKRKLLESAERWSRSGLVPLRGALFSEQSYLCLPGGFKLFSVCCVLRADHRQANNASCRCVQRVGNPAAPIVTNTGISCFPFISARCTKCSMKQRDM